MKIKSPQGEWGGNNLRENGELSSWRMGNYPQGEWGIILRENGELSSGEWGLLRNVIISSIVRSHNFRGLERSSIESSCKYRFRA